MPADQRVPGYLGRVLGADGTAVGTCFQVTPGVLITAWHVLDGLGAGDQAATVEVDALAGGAGAAPARVARVDPIHDLAVLLRAEPLPASVPGLSATDVVVLGTEVVVTGVSRVDDPEREYRFLDAPGRWAGGTTRDDQVPLGRLCSTSVPRGMSGAPVRRRSDSVVVGVVSGRYNSADGWLRDSVWVARTERLEALLAGVADVAVGGRAPLGGAVDLVLTVSQTEVWLHGGGLDVTAEHRGVRPGLVEVIDDVRRARSRVGRLRGSPPDVVATEVSLRRAGVLLGESFLPGPVRQALADVLGRAQAEHVPVRVGVAAAGLSWLPWEALPAPASGRPLALHPLVTVYRKLAAQPVRAIPGPLRIVVAIAAPDTGGAGVLDYERELRNVLAAVRGARSGAAQVRVVPFASTAAIRVALAEEPAHVLHLSGHGRPGTLVLEDELGAARPVDADTFVDEAIPAGSMPPVICLAACYTATPTETGATSFAARLVARGASVVIGTETSVTDRYATQLFARVYGELTGAPVPDVVRAVADARRLVQQQLTDSTDDRDRELALLDEWSVVTVLAGSGSVPVFDPAVTSAPTRPGPRAVSGLLARATGEFVGRRGEQRRLPTELLSTATAGAVLHGIGGVGKTTLAAEIIRRIFDHDPARVPVVLAGELSIDGVLSRVSGALRDQLMLTDAPGRLLRAAEMAGRVDLPWRQRFTLLRDHVLDQVPLLLVLDNFEDNLTSGSDGGYEVSDATLAGLLAGWAADPGNSRLLVTSRYEFSLPDGAEHHMRFRHIGPLTMAETLKLSWSLPALDRLEETELERVWRMVGGHPRTLEYLDALLRGGTARYHDVKARLAHAVQARLGPDKGTRWLATARDLDTALAESLTLAADDILLDELLDTLHSTPQAERLLLGASVYREPVDINALLFQIGDADEAAGYTPWLEARQRINQILATHGIDPFPDSRDAGLPPHVHTEIATCLDGLDWMPRPPRSTPLDLTRLTDRLAKTSLLVVDSDRATVFVHRWTASELERRAHSRGHQDEIRQAHDRAAEYWRWRLEAWTQGEVADVHYFLEARYHLLALGDSESAEFLAEHVCVQLRTWGAWDQATTLSHDALAHLAPDSPRRPVWIHHLGILAVRRGNYADAERLGRQSLRGFKRLGDQAGIAAGCHQLGIIAHQRGDYKKAERLYRQALRIKEWSDDQTGLANSYHMLGALAQDRGNYAEAERLCRQSLRISERLGDQTGMALCYYQLGTLTQRRGDYAEAERLCRRSLRINERLGDQVSMATSYHMLGVLARYQGDYREAERRCRQALRISERLGDQALMANNYGQLGVLAQDRGDYEEAERRCRQALRISERLGDQALMATAWSQLGNLAMTRRRYAEAAVWHLRALLVGLRLQVPQATSSARVLKKIRAHLGNDNFVAAVNMIINETQLAEIQAVLNSVESDDLGESRVR